MCTSLFLYNLHPSLLLLLAFNRDEFWDRPTHPAHFWPDEPHLLAGRDALRHGTWLGMTKHGRFAFLTNFREPLNAKDPSTFVKTTAAPSRGALTTDFLTGTMTPVEYLQGLDYEEYCGFNLLVGDLQLPQVAYVSNRGEGGPRVLPPGAYGVSNGLLQQWPKVHKGLAALKRCISVPAAAAAGAGHTHAPIHSQSESALAKCNSSSKSGSSSSSDLAPGQQDSGCGGSAAAAAPSTAAAAAATSSCAGGRDANGAVYQSDTSAAAPSAAAGVSNSAEHQAGDRSPAVDRSDTDLDLPWHVLFHNVLGDRQTLGPDEEVPLTGVGEALDRRLSAIFVEPFEFQPGSKYGTRSQTVIAVWRDGRVEQRERYVEKVQGAAADEQNSSDWVWKEVKHVFQMEAVEAAAGNGQQGAAAQQQQQLEICSE